MAPVIFWAAFRRFVGGCSPAFFLSVAPGFFRGFSAWPLVALVSGLPPRAGFLRRIPLRAGIRFNPRGGTCLSLRQAWRFMHGPSSRYRAFGYAGSSSPFSAFRWHSSQIIRVLPFMIVLFRLHRCRLQLSQGNIPFFSAVSQSRMTAAGRSAGVCLAGGLAAAPAALVPQGDALSPPLLPSLENPSGFWPGWDGAAS